MSMQSTVAGAFLIVQEIGLKFGYELSEGEAGYIAWNHTGFPHFWNIPADGSTPEEVFRTQVARYFSGDPTMAL